MNESPECARVLRKMTGCVIENARKIQKLKNYSVPSAETVETRRLDPSDVWLGSLS